MQGKRNCYNIMGSITSSLSSATPRKKSRWVLKCLCECRETIHTEYFWQPKCSLMSIKHPKHPKCSFMSIKHPKHPKTCYICYQNSSKKTKKKRLFDGNGMNSFSCKDTKHGAQLTLIDKNVI